MLAQPDTRSARRPSRRFRPFRTPLPSAQPSHSAQFLQIALAALWFGLAAGLVEVAILLYLNAANSGSFLGELQLNRHFAWLLPLGQSLIFGSVGLALALLQRLRRQSGPTVPLFVLLALFAFALLSMIDGLYDSAALVLALGLASPLAPRLARHPRALRLVVSATTPVFLALLALLTTQSLAQDNFQTSQFAQTPAPPASPNVLLIVLDTVRADHLSGYGYHRPTTPRLDAFARRGVTFEMARSPAPWTLPAHASIFTGRWPNELRLGTPSQPLDDTHPTLAEFFARHGYQTAGFVGNMHYCNTWFGLNRGFQHYEDHYEQTAELSPLSALRCSYLGRLLISLVTEPPYNARSSTPNPPKDARKLNRDFARWLETRQNRPFFAFLNYFDAHDPYLTPPEATTHFGAVPRSPEERDRLRLWDQFLVNHAQNLDLKPPARARALARDAYDDGLHALDQRLGELFDALDRQNLLENTIVVVTSDHGEQFGAHNLYGHGMSLHRPELHVPLLIVAPSRVPRAARVSRVVSTRSLAATLADMTGLSASSPFPGRSLVPLWDHSRTPAPPADDEIVSILSILDHPLASPRPNVAPSHNGTLTSLVLDDKVYIRDDFGAEQLYDLRADPDETVNLARQPDLAPLLTRARLAWKSLWTSPSSRPLCPVSTLKVE